MQIKRSPGLILTGLGIALALLSIFAPDAPFAPSSLFLPVMLIFFGRAISRGAKATKPRSTPTTFKMPPNVLVPPAPKPTRPARTTPPPVPAPVEVIVPEPSPKPARSDSSDLEERLRASQAESKSQPAPARKPVVERKSTPATKPVAPVVVPHAGSSGPVYPKPTPSSARAKSSKEMVEEAKKRLKRG